MSGGEALDLALGLLRAPARRGLLVARPLPTGMTTLLEVAGGSTTAANTASAATGATPEELLEASRFFVQQVLFHEGANAYRILGARPDAPQSQLLHHHRLLQRWLHPDRDGGQAWDSAFSARVNEAWTRVRTPHARRAYDAELAAQVPGAAVRAADPDPDAAGNPSSLVPARRVPPPPPSPARSIAGPLAVIAVTGACLGLLWLAQHRDTPAPDLAAGRPYVADTPQPQPPTDNPIALIADAIRPPDRVDRPDAADVPPTQTHATTPIPPAPETAVAGAGSRGEHGDLSFAGRREHSPDPQDGPHAIADETHAAQPVGRPYAADAPQTQTHAHASTPEIAEPPAPDAGIRGEHADPSFAGRRGRSPDLRDGAHAIAPAVHIDPAGRSYVAETHPPAPPTNLQSLAETDPLQLLEEAQRTAAQAAAYLASDGSHIPPIWNDFSTEVAAAEARARLALRRAAPAPGRMHLVSPQWRMGTEQAGLDAGYRLDQEGAAEEGRLRLEMARREQRWLVTNVSLEPTP